jgi:hypothetical protein
MNVQGKVGDVFLSPLKVRTRIRLMCCFTGRKCASKVAEYGGCYFLRMLIAVLCCLLTFI